MVQSELMEVSVLSEDSNSLTITLQIRVSGLPSGTYNLSEQEQTAYRECVLMPWARNALGSLEKISKLLIGSIEVVNATRSLRTFSLRQVLSPKKS